MGYDSPGWVAAFLGAIRMGAIPVPVNPLLQRSDDYDHYIEDSLARVVVVDPSSEEKVGQAVARAAHAPGLLRADQIGPGPEVAAAPTRKDDMAFWLYSSGSTGKPKAVVHLQHDIPYTCVTYAEQVLGITERDTTFSTTGLFHAYGFGNNLSFPYWVGASTVLHAGRNTPATVLETIEKRRPTLFFSAPTLYNAILNFEGAKGRDLSSIRHCVAAAEALPAEVWRRWKEAYGLTILDGVGSTEMLHIYCSNRLDEVRPGSSGKPVPGYELKILDPDGHPVAPGDAGDSTSRATARSPSTGPNTRRRSARSSATGSSQATATAWTPMVSTGYEGRLRRHDQGRAAFGSRRSRSSRPCWSTPRSRRARWSESGSKVSRRSRRS